MLSLHFSINLLNVFPHFSRLWSLIKLQNMSLSKQSLEMRLLTGSVETIPLGASGRFLSVFLFTARKLIETGILLSLQLISLQVRTHS